MKLLTALVIGLAVVLFSVPVIAGPLTGAPTIQFTVAGAGGTEGGVARPSYGLGVGITSFSFGALDPINNETLSYGLVGLLVNGEASYPLDAKGDMAASVGGWVARASGEVPTYGGGWDAAGTTFLVSRTDADDSKTLGEIHGRFTFARYFALELGTLLFDANKGDDPWTESASLGGFMGHLVLQTGPTKTGGLSAQMGVGFVQGKKYSTAFLAAHGYNPTRAVPPDYGEWKTGFSLYGNLSYSLSKSLNLYGSLWILAQTWHFDDAFVADQVSRGSGIDWADNSRALAQVSLGAGYMF